jgi:hypothetical protein
MNQTNINIRNNLENETNIVREFFLNPGLFSKRKFHLILLFYLEAKLNYSESNKISNVEHLNGAINHQDGAYHKERSDHNDCGLAMNESNLYLDMFHSLGGKQSIARKKICNEKIKIVGLDHLLLSVILRLKSNNEKKHFFN